MRRVVEHHVGPVVNLRVGAQRCDVGLHAVRQTEQLQRLIDHVRPQIKPQPAARQVLLTPAHPHFGAVTIDVRLKVRHLADQPLFDHLLHP